MSAGWAGAASYAGGAGAAASSGGPRVALPAVSLLQIGHAVVSLCPASPVGDASGLAAGSPDLRRRGSESAMMVDGGAGSRPGLLSLLPPRAAG